LLRARTVGCAGGGDGLRALRGNELEEFQLQEVMRLSSVASSVRTGFQLMLTEAWQYFGMLTDNDFELAECIALHRLMDRAFEAWHQALQH